MGCTGYGRRNAGFVSAAPSQHPKGRLQPSSSKMRSRAGCARVAPGLCRQHWPSAGCHWAPSSRLGMRQLWPVLPRFSWRCSEPAQPKPAANKPKQMRRPGGCSRLVWGLCGLLWPWASCSTALLSRVRLYGLYSRLSTGICSAGATDSTQLRPPACKPALAGAAPSRQPAAPCTRAALGRLPVSTSAVGLLAGGAASCTGRGSGGLLLVSSLAGTQQSPLI